MLSLRVWRILTAVIAACILVLSLIPNPRYIPSGFRFADKIAHLVAYAMLGFMLVVSLGKGRKIPVLLVEVAACLVFGALIELLQSFTYRDPEFLDLVADLIGSVCGVGLGAAAAGRIHLKAR